MSAVAIAAFVVAYVTIAMVSTWRFERWAVKGCPGIGRADRQALESAVLWWSMLLFMLVIPCIITLVSWLAGT